MHRMGGRQGIWLTLNRYPSIAWIAGHYTCLDNGTVCKETKYILVCGYADVFCCWDRVGEGKRRCKNSSPKNERGYNTTGTSVGLGLSGFCYSSSFFIWAMWQELEKAHPLQADEGSPFSSSSPQEPQPPDFCCLRMVWMAYQSRSATIAATSIFAMIGSMDIGTSHDEQHESSYQQCCQIGDASLPHEGKQEFSFAPQLLCHCAYGSDAGGGEQDEGHEGQCRGGGEQ